MKISSIDFLNQISVHVLTSLIMNETQLKVMNDYGTLRGHNWMLLAHRP